MCCSGSTSEEKPDVTTTEPLPVSGCCTGRRGVDQRVWSQGTTRHPCATTTATGCAAGSAATTAATGTGTNSATAAPGADGS